MGVKKQVKRLAAGASVALATSGLSNCHDGGGGGAVDPAPPPLHCNDLSAGQSLLATATRSADTVDVAVRSAGEATRWTVNQVVDVTGANLAGVRLPRPQTTDSLRLSLVLGSIPAQASFTIEATVYGLLNDSCAVRRTFHVNATASGVQVSAADLPLSAREGARIALVSREGRVVQLAAVTDFRGSRDVAWTVSDGILDAPTGSPVHWTLPAEPGIYRAELVIDFGTAGLALDQIMFEVG